MERPRLVFYCLPGLEADVFEQAMTNLGFEVRLVHDAAELLAALEPDRHIVPIVDSDGRHQEVAALLPAIRARLARHDIPVFIMDGKEELETDLPAINRVPAAHRLKEAVRGIDTYLRSLPGQSGLDLHTPRPSD